MLEATVGNEYFEFGLLNIIIRIKKQPEMDFNDDYEINIFDFAIFVSGWLECGKNLSEYYYWWLASLSFV